MKFSKKHLDRVFLALVILIIVLLSRIDSSIKVLYWGNRKAASFPSLMREKADKSKNFNHLFGKEFDLWFSDHLYYRKKIISFYFKMKYFLSGHYSNENVVMGKDDWYFIKTEDNIKQFQKRFTVNDEQVKKIISPIIKLAEYCKKNNKLFIVIITPIKAKVYSEFMHSGLLVDENGIDFPLFIGSSLKNNYDIEVVYPLAEISAHKNDGHFLYWKNDVHWTPLGAFWGYSELMQIVRNDYPEIKKYNLSEFYEPQYHPVGDLHFFNPVIPKDYSTEYAYPKITTVEPQITYDKKIEYYSRAHYFNENGNKKMLAFGDSMITALEPYLAYSFKDLVVIKETHHFKNAYKKIVDNADVVLMQIHERELQYPMILESDFY